MVTFEMVLKLRWNICIGAPLPEPADPALNRPLFARGDLLNFRFRLANFSPGDRNGVPWLPVAATFVPMA